MAVAGRMSASPWSRALAAVLAVLLLTASSASANVAKANPLGKVIELLRVLHNQTKDDTRAAGEAYQANDKFLTDELKKNDKIIEDSTTRITDLKGDLESEEALRVRLASERDQHAADVAKYENELKSAEDNRKEAHKLYLENSATYKQAKAQLDMAIEVLKKQAPPDYGSAASASASLVEVATNLRKTFQQGQGKDFLLSTSQRETLRSFFESVEEQAAEEKHQAARAPRQRRDGQAMAPDFLQMRRRAAQSEPSYGTYQKTSGSLQGTLQTLMDKVNTELTDAQTQESQELAAFQPNAASLKESIKTSQESLDQTKAALASSQETSSSKEADLQEVQTNLQVANKYKEELLATRASKQAEYKVQAKKRSDELIALQEAQKILFSETAKGLIADQTIGTVDFLQLAQEKHSRTCQRVVQRLLQNAPSPGLVLLALKAKTHLLTGAHTRTRGPFDKVKGMIRDMLMTLEKSQSEEAEKKSWCDKEMKETAETGERQARETRKKTGRKVASENELVEVTDAITELTNSTADMRKSLATTSAQRIQDRALAEQRITKYKDGTALLTRAVEVLKSYYASDVQGLDAAGKNRLGAGQGVIGILEIATEDFKELHEDTKTQEEQDARDFNEMSQAITLKLAGFEKELEYRQQQKTKLTLAISEMEQDLLELGKEVAASEKYTETLTQQCTITGPTYEERKARRAAELKSLQEALEILKGER